MSGRDDGFPGSASWGSDDKTAPMMVLQPPGAHSQAAAVTRTVGSILLIFMMVAAVVLAVGTFLMQLYYRDQAEQQRVLAPHIREVVQYRDALEELNTKLRQHETGSEALPLPAIPPELERIDKLRRDNEFLREAALAARTRRPPTTTTPRGTRPPPAPP